MLHHLDNPEFVDWIEQHSADDTARLRLSASKWPQPWVPDAIAQIERRRKAAAKLPLAASCPQFYFPDNLSLEQSTGEQLAGFHASLVAEGSTVADLTSGLGIDVMAMLARGCKVTAIDLNPALAEALPHNAKALNLPAPVAICADCREFVANYTGKKFDYIFIDPARRADDGSRLFAISQCSPNVVEMMPAMLRIAHTVIVKLSPMLDIAATLTELPLCKRIIALGTRTECKEIVAIITPESPTADPEVEAVTLLADGSQSRFAFTRSEEANAPTPSYQLPKAGQTMLTPYPSVMKAAPIKLLCARFNLTKPAANTHALFSSETPDSEALKAFPGEKAAVTEVLPYASSVIKRLARRVPKAAISVRNFGDTAAQLRARLRIAEDPTSSTRVTGITAHNSNRYLVITAKQS